MNDSFQFTTVESGIVLLTFNRPLLMNAINEDIIEGIESAVDVINKDESVKAVVLTGAGKAFCSGGNVKDMKNKTGIFTGNPQELRKNYQKHIQRIPVAMLSLQVPAIAAVNGPAYGAGCDIAMMCDMRVASETASFAESFIKLGLIPGDGGAWFLPRVIGAARAAEMTYTGLPVDANKALSWGMVNSVAPADKVLDEAIQLARQIAVNPSHAVRMSKVLLKESEKSELQSILQLSASLQALAHHTFDHDEAVDAFLAKRDPQFKGE